VDEAAPAAPEAETPGEAERLVAKQPAGLMAGRYGQPWLPLLTPVPVGAFVCSVVFDFGSRGAEEQVVYARAAFWLVGLGVVAAVVAGTLLVLDLLVVAPRTSAHRTAVARVATWVAAVLVFAASFAYRRGDSSFEAAPWWLVGLSLVALGLLLGSLVLGVRLTYRYGVLVADEDTQRAGFVATAGRG
jgi:uncharacterized membrane protein